MKLLLLTDIPPCTDLTAGLVLGKLARFVPPDRLACFTVLNPYLNPTLDPELAHMPLAVTPKPNEFGSRDEKRLIRSRTRSIAAETVRRFFYTPFLIEKAVSFGKAQGVDAVLAVLQGQTMMRMAPRVARALNADLYSLVWDPLSWWLRAHQVDAISRRGALKDFDRAIRASKAVATASWAMAEHYQSYYGVRAVPVISSHNQDEAGEPAQSFRKPGELVIGMAGQFYAHEEWWQLITALNHAGWRVGDRTVKLLVFGHDRPVGDIPEGRLDYRGFANQREVIRALTHEADVLYCPYPFAPQMEEVARLSFPSKLAMYFGCGRPVLFHGPDYSSPYRYLESRDAGVLCGQLEPSAVYNALCWLNEDPALYARAAANGMAAFRADFTMERMRESFFQFLGVGPEVFTAPMRAAVVSARAPHLRAHLEGARRQQASLASHAVLLRSGLEDIHRGFAAALHRLEAAAADPRYGALNSALQQVRASFNAALDPQALAQTMQRAMPALDAVAAAISEAAALGRQADAWRDRHAEARAQSARLEGELIRLTEEFARSATALGRAERQAVELERDIKLSAERFARTTEALQRSERQRQRSAVERAGERAREAALNRSLQNALAHAHASTEALRAELVVKSAEFDSAASIQAELQRNLDLTIADRDRLQAQLPGLYERLGELSSSNEELKRVSEMQLANLLGKLTSVERQLDVQAWLSDGGVGAGADLRERYLDLLEASLTGMLNEDRATSPWSGGRYDPAVRRIGRDWPATAVTMIGQARMRNLRHMVELTLRENVPGDYIETGVWRGGACIYMRAILAAYGDQSRKVWVADSFEGLPRPDAKAYPADAGDEHHQMEQLAVSLEEVKSNFARYGLLDDRVIFLKGWFKDTLPAAPIRPIAILRLDGDMYSSTIESLEALYDRVSRGGIVIVDDYILPACRLAIEDFRRARGISAPLHEVDGAAVYWRVGGARTELGGVARHAAE